MNYVGNILSNFKDFYQEINSATLNGSIDVVIVRQSDGTFISSPFHVRFGKIGVLRAREKLVDIEVNGKSVPLHMKLGEAGEAFFVEEITNNDIDLPPHMATSPIMDASQLIEDGMRDLKEYPELWQPSDQPFTDNTSEVDEKVDKRRDVKRRKRRKAKSTTGQSCSQDVFTIEISDTESLQTLDSSDELQPPTPETMTLTSEWTGNQFASGCHPFSDGDITPITSPIGSRPPTPKSDTEYEIGECSLIRRKLSDPTPTPPSTPHIEISHIHKISRPSSLIDTMETEWKWGELPISPAVTNSTNSPLNSKSSSAISSTVNSSDEGKEKAVEKTSGGLFNFMRKTKKLRHQPAQEGIYLDDLNLDQMDPEVAALYLYPSQRNNKQSKLEITDDCDDFLGDSSKLPEDAEDAESGTGESLPRSPEPTSQYEEYEINSSEFKSNFCRLLRFSTKHAPFYVTVLNTPPFHSDSIAMSLCGGHLDADHCVKEEIFSQYIVTREDFASKPSLLFDNNLVVRIHDKYYNWQVAGPQLMSMLAFQCPLPQNSVTDLKKKYMPKKERRRVWWSWSRGGASGVEVKSDTSEIKESISDSSSINKTSDLQSTSESLSKDDTDDSDTALSEYSSKEFKKSLKLNTTQIEQLGLNPGMNEVQYSVTTQYQGTTKCNSFIYLWNWDDRIIVSDIDGTITKSDVLGHVLPMIGKDWSQDGIARLYTQAAANGYKFLYLSARAIGQARITREYLSSVVQKGEMVLPIGPMLLSPSSLLSAFHKEVIERKPEEFKIGCLRDIKALFPSSRNPFYAGFGNKINDVWAYTAVKIPISRIFTVNYKGELRQETSSALNSTYSKLCDIVDHVFPPLIKRKRGDSEEGLESSELFPNSDNFSSFTYWREPLEIIDDLLLEQSAIVTASPSTSTTKRLSTGSIK